MVICMYSKLISLSNPKTNKYLKIAYPNFIDFSIWGKNPVQVFSKSMRYFSSLYHII